MLPWSPLARGRLTRDWNETSERQQRDQYGEQLYGATMESDRQVIDVVGKIAAARGVPRAQVALAWLLHKQRVTAPIIGASHSGHLTDAVAALSLHLNEQELAALEAPYVPHAVVGYQLAGQSRA